MKKHLQHLKEEEGYSLAELMVVLVIIGILLLLAIPKFTGVADRARETEAKMELQNLHSLQYAYRIENDIYANSLEALRFEQKVSTTEGGTARYQISIEQADALNFMAIAKAVTDGDGDGVFSTWEVDKTGKVRERNAD